MKKLFLVLALCIALLAGCGREGEYGGTGDPGPSGSMEDAASVEETAPPEESRSSQESQEGTSAPALALKEDEKIDILSEMKEVLSFRFDCTSVFEGGMEPDLDNYGTMRWVQFYQGEPVMLWTKENYYTMVDENGERQSVSVPDAGLYLSRADGSRECLIPYSRLEESLGSQAGRFIYLGNYTCHLDEEGRLYCASIGADDDGRGFFLKLDIDGKLLYKSVLEEGWQVDDFLQAPDGRMYLYQRKIDIQDGSKRLTEFDPETGAVAETDAYFLNNGSGGGAFGEGEDGIYMKTFVGYSKIDLEEGARSDFMMYKGTTYSSDWWRQKEDKRIWREGDFQVLADGSVEILHYGSETGTMTVEGGGEERKAETVSVLLETLRLFGDSRIPVVLRAESASGWLKNRAAEFNRSNDAYHVVLEELESSGAADAAEYARQTSVEIAAGKGPDILCGDLMEEYLGGLARKGALVDLGPYLEAEGLKEEHYLPVAFDGLRGEEAGGSAPVYGVNPEIYPAGYKIRREALEGLSGGMDIHLLMEALGSWEGDALYYGYFDSAQLLELFLEGSESLWGMVDWEQGTCDFGGELFAQILEAAARYGYDGRNARPNLAQRMSYASLYRYDSLSDLEEEGMAASGVLFDGGCFGAVDFRNMLAVNGESAQKEGALEFVLFLLGEEAQRGQDNSVPVNRAALEAWVELQLEETADGKEVYVGDTYVDDGELVRHEKVYTGVGRERAEEYIRELEKVRSLPVRNRQILSIILEEAGSYFGGDKGIPEVSAVIENRVQLYLDEG